MKRAYIKAFNALKKMKAPVFVNADNDQLGNFSISGEDGPEWASYYSQAPDSIFGVSPKVENVLSKNGLFSEWENPGKLNVYIS